MKGENEHNFIDRRHMQIPTMESAIWHKGPCSHFLTPAHTQIQEDEVVCINSLGRWTDGQLGTKQNKAVRSVATNSSQPHSFC